MSIAQIEERLEQVKSKLDSDKVRLDELRGKMARAKLLSKPVKQEVKEEVLNISEDIQNGPYQIEALEEQLAIEKAKIAADTRVSLLEQEKAAASEVEALSKELVTTLSAAMNVNDKLNLAYREYCSLKEVTGQSCISQNITRGSEGMLHYLYEIVSQELEGKIVQRQLVSVAI